MKQKTLTKQMPLALSVAPALTAWGGEGRGSAFLTRLLGSRGPVLKRTGSSDLPVMGETYCL